MSRLDDLRMVDPVLTTIAQGYLNASMVAGRLFPAVTVSRLKGKIPSFGREAFYKRDTFRSIRADSNRIPPSEVTMIDFETCEHDVEIAIDYLEEEESADFYKLEQRLAKELMDILLLEAELDAAAFVQDSNNFNPALVNSVTSSDAWDDYSGTTDPIVSIKDAMSAVRARIARYPNTMVLGPSSFRAIIDHPLVLDKIKYSGLAKGSVAILSELTGIPDIFVGLSVHTTDGTSFTDVWKDNAILAFVDKSDKSARSEFNPSFGYMFRREGKPEVDAYYENGGKIKVIRNTDNYCIKVTAADAAFLITNTNQN
jgi:hypothetical protein